MRLLNVHTLTFGEFVDGQIPPYCILSHRWGDDELTYKDFRKRAGSEVLGAGHQKIVNFCSFIRDRKVPLPQAERFVRWVWIDTICIDKRSSAELSEAINSMFRWYEKVVECIVYLKDVVNKITVDPHYPSHFENSDWFTRGWTLQELLAPRLCVFVNVFWEVLGHLCGDSHLRMGRCCRDSRSEAYGNPLHEVVSKITDIPAMLLKPTRAIRRERFPGASIAQRMCWASRRATTRVEDRAYCLLGIFKINMPLLYGEGDMAFFRLQEQIIGRSTDQSIFTWTMTKGWSPSSAFLAPSTRYFPLAGSITRMPSTLEEEEGPTYASTNKGLQIETTAIRISMQQLKAIEASSIHDRPVLESEETFLIPLNCYDKNTPQKDDDPKSKTFRHCMLAVRKVDGKFYRSHLETDLESEVLLSSGGEACHRKFTFNAYPN